MADTLSSSQGANCMYERIRRHRTAVFRRRYFYLPFDFQQDDCHDVIGKLLGEPRVIKQCIIFLYDINVSVASEGRKISKPCILTHIIAYILTCIIIYIVTCNVACVIREPVKVVKVHLQFSSHAGFTWWSYDIFTGLYGVIVIVIGDVQGAVRHIEQLIAGHISAHVNPVIIRSREGSMHHKFNSGVQIEVHPFISVSHSVSVF